jgi:DNA replication protein DnaC
MQLIEDHDSGKHDTFSPPLCPICGPTKKKTRSADFKDVNAYWQHVRRSLVTDGAAPDAEEVSEVDGGPLCATCHGLRLLRRDLPVGHAEFGKLIPCPDCRNITGDARLERLIASLPKKMQPWSFDTFRTHGDPILEERLALMREWAGTVDGDAWAFLGGPSDRGKTGLGISAMKALAKNGVGCVFITVPDLLDSIRQTFNKGAEGDLNYAETMAALRDVSLLFLDDFGKEKDTDFAVEKLFQLINARHGNLKRTIITSNLGLKELAEKLGDKAIVARIAEACQDRFALNFAGAPSLRLTVVK